MEDRPLGSCSCLSSLWDRLSGQKKTEDRSNQDVGMNPVHQSSGGSLARSGSLYVALCDFVAGQEDEMSIHKGDTLKVLGRSEKWWTVQKVDQNGQAHGTGNVPYECLERIEDLETQPWFFRTMTRSEAEDLLMNTENENGAFLVRRSESETVGYVLSVKSWTPVRHFQIQQDQEQRYHFESSQHFSSLVELVEHFANYGFEGIGKLAQPCAKEKPAVPDTLTGESELDFSVSLEEESLFVALWDFDGRQQEELSFLAGDQFKVLGRTDEWWRVQKVDEQGKVVACGVVPHNYLSMAGSLEAQPWFFGTLTRSETEASLKKQDQNGTFLIRRSDRDTVGYVFSVSTLVNHFKILKNKENNYHLQQTPHFSSVSSLVEHYIQHSVGSMGTLTKPCKRR
ncbi:hypothetical protein WMY93_027632 [Mugilogobius chulae]|uniref:non-specific protein-tyrosine kinase n=1 Tax=Mugilogobius chulae TaxID=88201 RepID=A0AAW0N5T4_9GOBI